MLKAQAAARRTSAPAGVWWYAAQRHREAIRKSSRPRAFRENTGPPQRKKESTGEASSAAASARGTASAEPTSPYARACHEPRGCSPPRRCPRAAGCAAPRATRASRESPPAPRAPGLAPPRPPRPPPAARATRGTPCPGRAWPPRTPRRRPRPPWRAAASSAAWWASAQERAKSWRHVWRGCPAPGTSSRAPPPALRLAVAERRQGQHQIHGQLPRQGQAPGNLGALLQRDEVHPASVRVEAPTSRSNAASSMSTSDSSRSSSVSAAAWTPTAMSASSPSGMKAHRKPPMKRDSPERGPDDWAGGVSGRRDKEEAPLQRGARPSTHGALPRIFPRPTPDATTHSREQHNERIVKNTYAVHQRMIAPSAGRSQSYYISVKYKRWKTRLALIHPHSVLPHSCHGRGARRGSSARARWPVSTCCGPWWAWGATAPCTRPSTASSAGAPR